MRFGLRSNGRPGCSTATTKTLEEGDVVPKGHVWLQGDNYHNSTDSRHYGPIPYSLLRGKVFYKIWPLSEAGPVKSTAPASS